MTFGIIVYTSLHMFEEEEEKEEIDDAVLDGLEEDVLAEDLLDEHGLPIPIVEPVLKEVDEFDPESKDFNELLEEEEEVDDYDSFDDHDEL